MLHAGPNSFDDMPDSAFVRETVIIGSMQGPSKNNAMKNSASTRGLIPVSRSTWRRMVKTGQAPAPVRLGEGISAWRVGDLRMWLEEVSRKNVIQPEM